jgi:nitroreductase/NAD-dependent dihydropyrimidine dehydrogenase PreA subunit
MTQPLTIDTALCKECGACVTECVQHLAKPKDGQLNHVDHTDPHCERCLHCYSVCPTGAIQLPETYTPLAGRADAWREITPQALEGLLAFRRSTRRFKPEPVSEDLIAQVVSAGRYVPSGGNRHAYQFTVLTDPGVKQALLDEFADYYGRLRKLMSSAVVKTLASPFLDPYKRAFINDPEYGRRMKDILERFHSGGDPVFYQAPAVIIIHNPAIIPTPREDSILAGFAMILTAQTLGLGTSFVSMAQKGLNNNDQCKALVGIPPEHEIHAVILLGYADVTYQRPAPKPEKPIHWV